MNQNTAEMVKYVEIAKKSQMSGLRKLVHSGPRKLGDGTNQSAPNHGRPMWISGKSAAHITANSVIASAERLIEVRHFWRNRNKIAEISVPAWPMPTQNTKLVMSKPQPMVLFRPQVPMPS